jgi:hypothetical protein
MLSFLHSFFSIKTYLPDFTIGKLLLNSPVMRIRFNFTPSLATLFELVKFLNFSVTHFSIPDLKSTLPLRCLRKNEMPLTYIAKTGYRIAENTYLRVFSRVLLTKDYLKVFYTTIL